MRKIEVSSQTGAKKLKVENCSHCLHGTNTVNLGVRSEEWGVATRKRDQNLTFKNLFAHCLHVGETAQETALYLGDISIYL